MSRSLFLRLLWKKFLSGRKLGGKGKFAIASEEEANNREKARKVYYYCPQDY